MLIARQEQPRAFREGQVLDGYLIEGALAALNAAEERYAVRDGDGAEATLVAAARAFGSRRERARFRARAAARMELDHPALLRIRAFGEADERPYLITDPQPARTLADRIADGPLDPEEVVTLLAPVAEALDLAHDRELVHQSLGPQSLLLDERGRLLVDTFGIAGAAAASETEPEELLYRAPEELRGERPGPKANVYSLCALLVHALGGEPGRDDRAGAPPKGLLGWAMTENARERPSSARALMSAVAQLLGTKTRPPAPLNAAPRVRAAAPAAAYATRGPGAAAGLDERPGVRRALATAVAVAALCGALLAVVLDPFGEDAAAGPAPAVVAAAWERLEERRAELRERLAIAGTPQEQADIAGSLAAAYDAVADASPAGPRSAAAHFAAVAYAELAAAAEANDESAYAGAAGAVGEAEQRLARALRSPR